jgi:hypothetical protein
MKIVRTILARPVGTARRFDRSLPGDTCIAMLNVQGDTPFDGTVSGVIVRHGLLWKNATLHLATSRGLEIAEGMPAIMKTLERVLPGARIRIALPLHQGYVALYGPDGHVAARILEDEKGLNVRYMDPHAASMTNAVADWVIERTFMRLEDERDERA